MSAFVTVLFVLLVAQAPKPGAVSTTQIVLDANSKKITLDLTQVSGD